MVENSPHERTGARGRPRFDGATWDVHTVPRMYLEPVAAPWEAHHSVPTLRLIKAILFALRVSVLRMLVI